MDGGRMFRTTAICGSAALVGFAAIAAIAAPRASAAPFASCDQAYAAGAAPLIIGQPGYSPSLDRDGDGVACELAGQPAPVPTSPPLTATSVCPAPSGSSTAAVIGCYCHPLSSDTVTAEGAPAYCRQVLTTELTIWSNRPADIPFPQVPGGTNINMYVCESQTGQSSSECAVYLTQPSYPGNGVPHY